MSKLLESRGRSRINTVSSARSLINTVLCRVVLGDPRRRSAALDHMILVSFERSRASGTRAVTHLYQVESLGHFRDVAHQVSVGFPRRAERRARDESLGRDDARCVSRECGNMCMSKVKCVSGEVRWRDETPAAGRLFGTTILPFVYRGTDFRWIWRLLRLPIGECDIRNR